jgi:hypothetical protein
MRRGLRSLGVAAWLGMAVPAGAATVYVTVEGTDTGGCGSKTAPCRSISRGVDVAGAGDTVLVGPGVYGDANRDGALDDPGDEVSAPACFCAIQVSKPVSIVSEAGAAATIVDAAGLADATFRVEAGGVTIGRRNGGFTVTGGQEVGIVVPTGSTGATIAGNVVVGNQLYGLSVDGSGHRIEDNRASGHSVANLEVRGAATTLARNVATSGVGAGILLIGGGVTSTDDVAAGNGTGLTLFGATTLTRVSVLNNATTGILVDSDLLVLRGGRVVGNDPTTNCGITLDEPTAALDASGVWFGSAAGPGVEPADAVCASGQSVVVEKNAKKPPKLKLKPQR